VSLLKKTISFLVVETINVTHCNIILTYVHKKKDGTLG